MIFFQFLDCYLKTSKFLKQIIMRINKKYLKFYLLLAVLLAFHSPINAQEPSVQTSSIPSYSVDDNILGQNSDLNDSSINAQEPSVQTSSITSYSVGDNILGRNSDLNQGRGFHIVQIENIQKKYLFTQFKPSDQSRFLQIALYLYRGTEKTPFKVCKKQEVDSCYVPQAELSKNSQLLMIVDCQQACQYQMRLYWSNLEHLKPSDNIKFMFAEQKSQLYHLELQKVGDFAQVRLILKPQTRRQMFDKVKIYGKYGSESVPSAQNYDFKSMHLWLDAQGVYLQKEEIKNKNINLLIVGQSKTVYFLTCQLVNKTTHDLYPGQILDQYLQPQKQATYHLNFTTNNQISFQQYTFKFQAFNGNLSVGFYTDQNFTKPYTDQPYMYMSDVQYIFSREQVLSSYVNGFYIKIKSHDRISTYVMEFIGRSIQQTIQIKQNVYEMIRVQYAKPKLVHFNSYFYFEELQTFQQNFTFTVHLINVKGSHGLVFRVCQIDFDKCLNSKTFANYSKVVQIKNYDQIGTKKTFRLQIPKNLLSNINTVEKKLTVLMVVSNMQNSNSIVGLQYYADSKYHILRQSRPVQSRIKTHQQKLYKFTNVDKKIKQIRIYINKISGSVNVISLRTDPQIKNDGRKQFSNCVSFTEQLLQKPVFLIIFAQQQSIVSLNVRLIHQNIQYISSITIQQDVQFKIRIPPLQIQFLQIHPVYDAIYFDYRSSGLALVCQYSNKKCKTQIPKMGIQGNIVVNNFKGRNQLIMIQNPSDSRSIQFTAIYHSSDYDHCEHKKIGTIYTEVVKGRICYQFSLTKVEQLEIFITRLDLGEVHLAFLLCNNVIDLRHEDGKYLYKIDNQTMIKNCNQHQHKVLVVVMSGQKLRQQKNQDQKQNKDSKKVSTFKAKLSVQYLNEDGVFISDGISYSSSKIAKEQALQVFFYEVINKVNTSIIMTNKIGNAYFTVKAVHTVERKRFLNDSKFDFTSSNTNYYMTPVVSISSFFLINADCHDQCTLIIKVYSKQKLGARNDFSIEVTQNYFVLQQHKMRQDFLTKDAFSYYSFVNKQQGNSLLIQTSDHNKKCTKIILSGKQYPSENNNFQIQYGNQLIYENAQPKTYFIAVQATQNCAYSISVSTTKTHITLLQRGKLGYLKLKQGQVKFFMFHRLSSTPFKILSNHVYGEIEFYVNNTNTDQIANLVKKKQIDYKKFKVKGQFKNRLIMDQNLCQNCYYILACYAKKATDTVIYFGDQDSFLSISERKSVNDLLKKKGDTLKGFYYQIQDTLLKVKVHSGKLSIKIIYGDQKYQKSFERKDDMYEQIFKLKRKTDDWTPALVQLVAQEDQTVYSIRLQSKLSTQYSTTVDELQITPGQPNYIYMSVQKVYCLRGYLRDISQQIMITADEIYQHGLKDLQIQVVLNGTQVNYSKKITRNILSILFDVNKTQITQPKKYGICLSSKKQSFSATAYQTEDVYIIPADIQTVAYDAQIYAIRPDGNFMIDVFECIEKSNITYSQKLSELNDSKKTSLDILGLADQPHAFKINQYDTTFLKIQTKMAIVRWIPMDEKQQTGLGYLQYKVGNIKYSSSQDSVQVTWQGLSRKSQVHTKVVSIVYNIYISNQTYILQIAQNCDYFVNLQQILIYRLPIKEKNLLSRTQQFNIKKSQLKQKFQITQNLYMSIVAEVEIEPVNQDKEHYRFLYNKQQIPKQVFAAAQNNEYLNKLTYIGMIVAGIVAFLIFSCICTKKIIPLLARLKNRLLIQEADDKNNDDQLGDVPPPSSERKAIQLNLGTEDKMNDQIQKK